MGEILRYIGRKVPENFYICGTMADALLEAGPFDLPCLSRSFSLSPASLGESARVSSLCESTAGISEDRYWVGDGSKRARNGARGGQLRRQASDSS
jgi:hypothetical protein